MENRLIRIRETTIREFGNLMYLIDVLMYLIDVFPFK